MKKAITAVATIVAVMAMSAVMAACSVSFEGTYKFSSMSMSGGGLSMSYEVGQELDGVAITEDFYVLTVNGDGTFTMVCEMMEENMSGTWEASGSTITLTADGESVQGSLKGGTLTVSQSEEGYAMTISFVKR